MNHRIQLAALLLVACGGPAAEPARPRLSPLAAIASAAPPPASAPTAAPAPAPAPTPPGIGQPVAPLPPARPETLSLARTGDAALDALLAPADKAFEASDFAAAEKGYAAAKAKFPKRAAGAVGVLRTRIAKRSSGNGFAASEKDAEITAAARDLEKAQTLEPTYGPAFVEHGRARLLLGDAAAAESALRKGVELLPQEPEAHSALGVALLAVGKGDEALAELTRARDLDPGSAARRGNLGTVLFMRGKVREALAEYEIQARLLPADARAHSDLGTALLASEDLPRALAELRRAVELDPKRATFRSNLGYALQLAGKNDEAIGSYREAIRLDAKLASAWINLATVLSRDAATRPEARRALETARKLDPSDPRVIANLEELDALEKTEKRVPASH